MAELNHLLSAQSTKIIWDKLPNEIFENPHFALNMTLVHKITFCVQSCLESNHPIVLEEAQWTNKVVAAADDQGGALVWTHHNTVL